MKKKSPTKRKGVAPARVKRGNGEAAMRDLARKLKLELKSEDVSIGVDRHPMQRLEAQ